MLTGLLVIATALVGCAGDDGPCQSLPLEGGDLEIGGSPETSIGFEPFADDADRPLVRGQQGGFHVWLGLQGRGLCPGRTDLEVRVFEQSTDTMPVFFHQPLRFEPAVDDPAVVELPRGIPMFICPSSMAGTPIADATYRVEVVATDVDGRRAASSRTFVPRCDASIQDGAFYDTCRCLCGDVCM